jgi:hypothetical protein
MSNGNFIPVGRTSLAQQGGRSLQVQTEYAPRPVPRITTTISHEGQVVHKVERSLDHAVESVDEQSRVERTLRRQHTEIVEIIERSPKNKQEEVPPESEPAMAEYELPGTTVDHAGIPDQEDDSFIASASAFERIKGLPGVQHVYRVDNEGNLIGKHSSKQFRKAFGAIFKNIEELINLFGRIPGIGLSRELGVCELERDRLYFVSAGLECYFIVVENADIDTDYEEILNVIVGNHKP